MFRIREEDGAVGGPKWEFGGGEPEHGILPTIITHRWLNDVQNELVNAVEGLGQDLNAGDQSQILKAIVRSQDKVVVDPYGHYPTLKDALSKVGDRTSILVTTAQALDDPLRITQDFLSIRFRWGTTIQKTGQDFDYLFLVEANGFRLEDLHTQEFKYLVRFKQDPLPPFAFLRNCTLKDGTAAVHGTPPPNLDLSTVVMY